METAETKQTGWSNNLPIRAILLLILTFIAYLPALRGGFIWDDGPLIIENPIIKAGDGFYRLWFTTEAQDYYPLTQSMWWLEWHLWGNHAAGYHAINVLLHAINAVLVWVILRRLKIPGAWLAALIFAVHPVNVATAAWVSEQKNTLSMLLYAVSILLYLLFYEESRWRWYGWSLVVFLLALLSKTAVVMLPVLLLGFVWWMRGRVTWKDVLYSAPFFVLSLVLGLFTMWYQYHLALGEPGTGTDGFAFRLAAAGCAPWFYLGKVLWPINLMAVYPRWQMDTSKWVAFLPGAALVACFLVFWWKRQTWGRPLLFGLGYFVVMLFPVLGLLKQGPYRLTVIADRWDHWQYYSIIGVIALVVAAGEKFFYRMGDTRRYWATTAAVVIVIVLGTASWQRGLIYASAETLWRDTLAKNPQAWVAELNLGDVMWQTGRIQDAMMHYEQALRIKPDYVGAHLDLGAALLKLGKPEDAIRHYEQALQIEPNSAEVHRNLGVGLERVGRVPEAIGHYEEALRINPNSADAHDDLANALLRLGKIPEAIEQYEQALKLNPGSAETHINLAGALSRQGKVAEAVAHYTEALRITPGLAEAHNNLGAALVRLGKRDEAIAHYEKALQLRPDYADAHFNLGLALEKMGRTPEAIEQYEQTLKLRPDFIPATRALIRLRGGP